MKTTSTYLASKNVIIKSFIILTLTTSVAEAQLTGVYRASFLNEYFERCYLLQRSSSENAAFPDKVIEQYCRCLGNYVADSISNSVVKDIEDGNISIDVMSSASRMASKYCGKNYQKY